MPDSDEPPVGHIQKTRKAVVAHGEPIPWRHVLVYIDGNEEQYEEERGQQPACPPRPEMRKRDRRVAAVLEHEQGRDEKARQYEEGVDSEEATTRRPIVVVVSNDSQNRERANAIQGRLVPQDSPLHCAHLAHEGAAPCLRSLKCQAMEARASAPQTAGGTRKRFLATRSIRNRAAQGRGETPQAL